MSESQTSTEKAESSTKGPNVTPGSIPTGSAVPASPSSNNNPDTEDSHNDDTENPAAVPEKTENESNADEGQDSPASELEAASVEEPESEPAAVEDGSKDVEATDGEVEKNNEETAADVDVAEVENNEKEATEVEAEIEEETEVDIKEDDAEDTAADGDAGDEEEESSEVSGKVSHFNTAIKAGILEETVSGLRALVDECKIRLTQSGFHIRAVDPANVAMVEQDIGKAAFETYEIDEGIIGLDLERFEDIISMPNKDDLVTLRLDPQSRKMKILFDGLDFTMALIDPKSIRAEPDIPELELPGAVTVNSDKLDRMVTASDMVSDHLSFGINQTKGAFYATAEGDTDDVTVEYERNEVEDLELADAHSIFALGYMKDIENELPSDTPIKMRLGDSMPTKLSFQFEGEAIDVLYMLAPRIEN